MKNIEQYFKKLNDENINIDTLITRYKKDDLENEEKNKVYELFEILKKFKKCNDIEISIILKQYITKKDLIEYIEKIITTSLKRYYDVAKLREIENKNFYLAKAFINDMFNHYIIRFNPNFINQYEEYTFESTTQIENTINSFDFLFEFYASRGFEKSYIIDDLKEELELSTELTNYCVELFEKNYMLIRQNIIMYKIQELDANLTKLKNNTLK